MMKRLAWVTVLGLVAMSTGCATLRGDKQRMKIESEPSGAALTVNGAKYTTPAEVDLKRKETHKITLAKAGFRPITFNLESHWDGAALTDVVLPGGSVLLGWSVVSGSDRSFKSLTKIKLEPTTEPNPAPLEMYAFEGRILTKPEYDRAVKEAEQSRNFYRDQ